MVKILLKYRGASPIFGLNILFYFDASAFSFIYFPGQLSHLIG